MKLVRPYDFGNVEACEFGYSPFHRMFITAVIYLVDGVLIDTAMLWMQKEVLGLLKDKTVHHILLTHHHEDHSGNVSALIQDKHVPAYGHPVTVEKMRRGFNIQLYQRLMFGKSEKAAILTLPQVFDTGRYSFVPIHTPGHSKDHMVFFEKNQGWLFSGDLYIATNIRCFRSDVKIDETISSIKKILKLDFDSLFCAHNPKVKNGKEALASKLDFLENFYGEVKRYVEKGYSARDIYRKMRSREVWFVKMWTLGRASLEIMVHETVRAINERASAW